MTSIKKVLMAATALTMVAGAAYAGSGNNVLILQGSDSNSTGNVAKATQTDASDSNIGESAGTGIPVRQNGTATG